MREIQTEAEAGTAKVEVTAGKGAKFKLEQAQRKAEPYPSLPSCLELNPHSPHPEPVEG